MRSEHTVTLADGSTVVVYELDVAGVRQWLKRLESPASLADPGDGVLFSEIGLHDLLYLTSLTEERIDALSMAELQSMLDLVVPVVMEVNADFFARMRLLADRGQAVLAAIQQLSVVT